MKNAKRTPKKKDPSKTKAKPAAAKELTEEQLENVAGGAVDAYMKFWSGPGEVTTAPTAITITGTTLKE